MPKRRRLDREQVIETAAALADEAGSVSAIRLSALARALQIQPPSLYNHVDGIADLRYGLSLHALRLLIDDLRRATQGLVGRAALTAVAATYRRFAHDHPGLYPLTVRAPDPGQTELVEMSQELLQLLLLLMASEGLKGDDALHAIRGLRSLLHGFISLETAGGFKMALDRDESFQRLVSTYLDQL